MTTSRPAAYCVHLPRNAPLQFQVTTTHDLLPRLALTASMPVAHSLRAPAKRCHLTVGIAVTTRYQPLTICSQALLIFKWSLTRSFESYTYTVTFEASWVKDVDFAFPGKGILALQACKQPGGRQLSGSFEMLRAVEAASQPTLGETMGGGCNSCRTLGAGSRAQLVELHKLRCSYTNKAANRRNRST